MIKFLSWLLLCAGLAGAGGVVHADDLSLDAALSTAMTFNPELLAARKTIEAAAGRAVQARLWPNPELELSSEELPPSRGGFSGAQNLGGLSQTVPFPGKKPLDGRIGQAKVRSVEAQYRAVEVALVRDVKKAFYRVLASERRVTIGEELVTLAESLAQTARKRVEAGATASQEQVRAVIELDRVKTDLVALRREVIEARLALARLMGQPDQREVPLAGQLPVSTDLPDIAQAREELLRAHPRLAVATAEHERAELELRRARLEPYPDVTVGVAAGRDAAENESLMAVRLSIPLPLADRAQGRKRESAANVEVARAERTATEQRLLEELRVAEARLRAAVEQVTAYRDRILPNAEEALRLVQRGFEAGKFGFIDLLDTQRTVAEARLAYQDKLLELNSAAAELEALTTGAQK